MRYDPTEPTPAIKALALGGMAAAGGVVWLVFGDGFIQAAATMAFLSTAYVAAYFMLLARWKPFENLFWIAIGAFGLSLCYFFFLAVKIFIGMLTE